jgi:hypothetical protein
VWVILITVLAFMLAHLLYLLSLPALLSGASVFVWNNKSGQWQERTRVANPAV